MSKKNSKKPAKLSGDPYSSEQHDFEQFMEAVENLDSAIIKDKKKKSIEAENPSNGGKAKNSRTENFKIDLHGMTLDEAKNYSVSRIKSITSQNKGKKISIEVITGRGLHSKDFKPVLADDLYSFLSNKYSGIYRNIDPAPMDNTIDGIPVKGSFKIYFH